MAERETRQAPEYHLAATSPEELEDELGRVMPLDQQTLAHAPLPPRLRHKLVRLSVIETVVLTLIIALLCLGVVFVAMHYIGARPSGEPSGLVWYQAPAPMQPETDPAAAQVPVPPLASVMRWQFALNASQVSVPVCAEDGSLLLTLDRRRLLALANNGSERFTFTPAGASGVRVSAPAATDLVGAVVGLSNGQVVKVNGWGDSEWTFQAGSAVEARPVIDRHSCVYCACADAQLYCLTPTGTLNWRCQLSAPCTETSPILAAGVVYQVTDTGVVACLKQGKLAWQHDFGLHPKTQAVASGENLCGIDQQGNLLAISPAGAEVWRVPLGRAAGMPGAADGVVYAGNWSGEIFAITPTGQLQWQAQIGGAPAGIRVRPSDGQVYVWAQNGKFYVLDQAGALLYSYDGAMAARGVAFSPDGTVYFTGDDLVTAIKD